MTLIEAQHITRRFGGVVALDDAEFRCDVGEIHALLGENGAGKSTMVKILSGVLPPDSGTIHFKGEPIALNDPARAARLGIVPVFQELSLIPDLTVAQNIFLGDEPRNRWRLIDMAALNRRASALLADLEFRTIDPQTVTRELALAERQLVEIAKAVAKNPQVLILDEGTSALGAGEVQQVFTILRRLREQGCAVVYISHRMEEIQSICDSATVFRDGHHVATFDLGSKGHDEIVRMMIGRKLVEVFPPRPPRPAAPEPLLEARGLSWEGRLRDVGLHAARRRDPGLSGPGDGQGQGDLLFALFGAYAGVHGSVLLGGRPVHIRGPRDADAGNIGMALVPDDRKTQGLILPMSLRANITLPTLGAAARGGVLNPAVEQARANEMVRRLAIKTVSIETPTRSQRRQSAEGRDREVAARGGARFPADDPTRGIDVATKQEIYALMRSLADSGIGLLFFSTDLSEIVNMCDRALVMYEGQVVRELSGADLTETNLVSACAKPDRARRFTDSVGEANTAT